jgi:hypothetical protein
MEEGNTNPKDYNDIFVDGWKPDLAEWSIPEAPGLGVNFSPQFLKERTVKICASERLGCRLATLS